MERGLRALLSPNEELTLCRVAIGIALAKDLSPADVLRLRNLALVDDHGERLKLTALGLQRYQRFHRTHGGPPEDNAVDRELRQALYLQTLAANKQK